MLVLWRMCWLITPFRKSRLPDVADVDPQDAERIETLERELARARK